MKDIQEMRIKDIAMICQRNGCEDRDDGNVACGDCVFSDDDGTCALCSACDICSVYGLTGDITPAKWLSLKGSIDKNGKWIKEKGQKNGA